MKIRLLIVGKVENKSYNELSNLYLGRIQHYIPVSLESVKPEKISSMSKVEIIHLEGDRLMEKLSPEEYVIALDKNGSHHSSEEFAHFLQSLHNQSRKYITFVVGGPLGLSDKVQARANSIISLSKMTFAHELSAIIILEQIYRAMNITYGGKYHK